MATFGERLLLERRRLDVNQDDLAIRANVNRAYISNLERGHAENPSVAVVEAIAKALGVNVHQNQYNIRKKRPQKSKDF